jgi:hypothetical protein
MGIIEISGKVVTNFSNKKVILAVFLLNDVVVQVHKIILHHETDYKPNVNDIVTVRGFLEPKKENDLDLLFVDSSHQQSLKFFIRVNGQVFCL